ncbi:MAG: sigma-70 family RNA polymerase sigma factor [Eubacteriales bacterium]|nr:sigma-70 family RNA polymerase sigma factor [Eubacteriales bacterium]
MATSEQKQAIYCAYHGKVWGYIRSKINNAQDAEDLAADVFVKVYEKLNSFDETKASLSTWIYTITRNTLTDYFRTRRTFEEIPETLEGSSSIEESVCSAEMLEALAKALEALDERERDIIILRFYKGKTLAEIAKQMGISYAYVKVLQNKAFHVLKDFLGNE